MPSLKTAQASMALETLEALSVPPSVLIFGAASRVETVMEIVDRVCGPVFRRAGQDSKFGGHVRSIENRASRLGNESQFLMRRSDNVKERGLTQSC
jgi:hypothetical protein